MEQVTIDLKLNLKKATNDYFYNGRAIVWGTIFYLQKSNDRNQYEGPFSLAPDHVPYMKEWLEKGLVWVKNNFKE